MRRGWIALLFFLAPAMTGLGTNYYWNVSSGNWTDPGNWSPNGVPGNASDCGIIMSGTCVANADLGSSGDRPTVIVSNNATLDMTTSLVSPRVELRGGAIDASGANRTIASLSASGGVINTHWDFGYTLFGTATLENASYTVISNRGKVEMTLSGPGGAIFLSADTSDSNPLWLTGNMRDSAFSGGSILSNSIGSMVYFRSQGRHGLSTNNVVQVHSNVLWYCDEYSPDSGGTRRYDIELRGGQIVVSQCVLSNRVTVLAPGSQIREGTVRSYLCGPVPLLAGVGGGAAVSLWNPTNSVAGITVAPNGHCDIITPGAQGTGALHTAGSGSWLHFDSASEISWDLTNRLSGYGIVAVESGSNTAESIRLHGVFAPGTDGGAGAMEIRGKFELSSESTFKLDIENSNTYDKVTVYGKSVSVYGGLSANLAWSRTNRYEGAVIPILMNGSTSAVVGTFADLPQDANLRFNQGGRARISYNWNADGGGLGNDIVLYDFQTVFGTLLTVR